MKFEIINKNSFIIKLNNSYKILNKDNQDDIIKKIITIIRKRYGYNVLGFYEVNIYKVSSMFSLLLFTKINNDRLYNNIDLRIINHNTDISLYIDDYEIMNKNYLKSSDIEIGDIYKLCEHYTYIMPNLHS